MRRAFLVLIICICAESSVFSQVVSLSCPFSLPPSVGGACDYLNSQAFEGKISLRFGVDNSNVSFGADDQGVLVVHGTVYTVAADGTQGTAKVRYTINLRDAKIVNYSDTIRIICDSSKCINISNDLLSMGDYDETEFTVDENIVDEVAKSLEEIKSYARQ
ncbi:hypothetical protein [Rhizobium leguminosarum]|uniref:Uncharacterized protein n=1 Tax=Rhizobium leguminosarum TaxID=384 RepID=A0A7M3DQK0_RHILE|nr:hypothetical protein [Rhizobium leguminosarum]TAY50937.1 hypothetical protein ELH90_04050 [Rhizobium leguminosarum]